MTYPKITFERLADFFSDNLNEAEAAEVRQQLDQADPGDPLHARLRSVIDDLRNDDQVEAPPGLVERAIGLMNSRREAARSSWLARMSAAVAELVFDSRAQVTLAGFRGGSASAQLSFETADATIDLRLSRHESGPLWRIQGQLAPCLTDRPATVQLLESYTLHEHARTTSADGGRFELDAAPGAYDLVIERSDQSIVIDELRIG